MGGPTHYSPVFEPVPLPTPEHQKRITKQKWFEVILVVALIVGGAGYLGLRDFRQRHHVDPALGLAKSAAATERAGATAAGTSTLMGRQCLSLTQKLDTFDCHIDLVGEASDAPLETAIIWLTPLPGTSAPSAVALQKAVNTVGVFAQKLVGASTDALEKASNTMVSVSDTQRPHDKGVAGTSDGWKLTYVTYRTFDETAAPQPMLCLVLQRLSAASDPKLADFNRILYESIHRGDDVKAALLAGR
jgi:hypothetical protein